MGFLSGLGAVAGVVGGVADFFGSRERNRSQETMAKDANAFSAAQTRAQMDFEERMSNTAHQREVADLKAAGLNPLLALNGGASSPSGASSSGQQAQIVPELSGVSSSALNFVRLLQDIKESNSRVALNDKSGVWKVDLDEAEGERRYALRKLIEQQIKASAFQNEIMENRMKYERDDRLPTGLMDALGSRLGLFNSAGGAARYMFGD